MNKLLTFLILSLALPLTVHAQKCAQLPPGYPALNQAQKQIITTLRKQLISKKYEDVLLHTESSKLKGIEGPHTAEFFILRGLAYQAKNDMTKAKLNWNMALSIVNMAPPFDLQSHKIRAEAANLLGDKSKEAESLSRIKACEN